MKIKQCSAQLAPTALLSYQVNPNISFFDDSLPGNTIDATALNALLDETEGWMWDKPDAPLADLTHKVR